MRRSLSLTLVALFLPAATLAQSWLGGESEPPRPPAAPAPQELRTPPPAANPPEEEATIEVPVLVSLGSVAGDGYTTLEVISINGRTRARSWGTDRRLQAWLTMAGAPPTELTNRLGRITAMTLDRKGRWLAAGDEKGKLCVWEWESGRSPVYSLDFPKAVQHVAIRGRRGDRLVVQAGGEKPTVIRLPAW